MPDQCIAVTGDGDRCSRQAQDDGFCYQHGPEDETVDEEEKPESNDEDTEASKESSDADVSTTDDSPDADADQAESTGDDERSDIVRVRDSVRERVPDLIGRELDGVTSLRRDDEGWTATVELIERRAVPDTQDILGQYEVTLAADAEIRGYRRLETYRRAEGPPYEA